MLKNKKNYHMFYFYMSMLFMEKYLETVSRFNWTCTHSECWEVLSYAYFSCSSWKVLLLFVWTAINLHYLSMKQNYLVSIGSWGHFTCLPLIFIIVKSEIVFYYLLLRCFRWFFYSLNEVLLILTFANYLADFYLPYLYSLLMDLHSTGKESLFWQVIYALIYT